MRYFNFSGANFYLIFKGIIEEGDLILEPEVHVIEKYFQEMLRCFTITNIARALFLTLFYDDWIIQWTLEARKHE